MREVRLSRKGIRLLLGRLILFGRLSRRISAAMAPKDGFSESSIAGYP